MSQENTREYRAYIANCLLNGELPSAVGQEQTFNVIKLNLDNLDIRLVQKPKFIVQPWDQFNGRTFYTTDLVISELEPSDFERARRLSREVAILLSLATASEVWDFGYHYPAIQPDKEIHSFVGCTWYGQPIIDTRFGKIVRTFLEQTWSTFRALREKRQLDIAFDYVVKAQLVRQPIELGLVITFVLLENLKTTFALQHDVPFIKGKFRKPNNHKQEYPFHDLLKAMLSSVGMSPDLSPVVKLRNTLIHSGITQLEIEARVAIYTFAQDIVREYLLRLIGYKEEYHPYQYRFIRYD